jgi:hypothetical protein
LFVLIESVFHIVSIKSKKMDTQTMTGTIYKVFEWHGKQNLDASGNAPVIIKPEPKDEKKHKK